VTFAGSALVLFAGAGLVLGLIFALMMFASSRAAGTHLAQGMALAAPDARAAVAATNAAPGSKTIRAATHDALLDVAESQRIVAQLNEYYAANVNQGNAIFWASLLAMSIGFVIVFVGILNAGNTSTTTIVAGVAGVLSQLIAATFLVALRSTQQQSTTYAQTLVELRLRDLRSATDAQAVALGLELLGEISGDGAQTLANQTRAALAMGLIVNQAVPPRATPVVPAPVDGDDGSRDAFGIVYARPQAIRFDSSGSGLEQPANEARSGTSHGTTE
jgi:hypothetical protein